MRPQCRECEAAAGRGVRRWGDTKRACDNHLEGSSLKRYSEVAEAMSNLIGRGGASDAPLWRD
jgi:hypothetical protein